MFDTAEHQRIAQKLMLIHILGVIPTPCVPPTAMLWHEQWLPSHPHSSASRALLRAWDYCGSGVMDWSVTYWSYFS